MAFDTRNTDTEFHSERGAVVAWIFLVATLSVGGSLAFACAAPLAAVAALAASKMDRNSGLALAVLAWLSNQIVGYELLHYPQTLNSFEWGAAIGVATVVAFLTARAANSLAHSKYLAPALSFVAAFATYELTLFTAGIPLGAEAEAFSLAVVTRILEVNVISFLGLLVLYRLASLLIPMASQRRSSAA